MASKIDSTPATNQTQKGYVVAKVGEIEPGQRKVVTVQGREIGLFNIKGQYHALRNRCPHRGAPLCQGRLRPLIVPDGVYGVDYTRDDEILKCPWHLWEFDVTTGQALYEPELRVRTYRVEQEGNDIVLYLT